MNLSLPEDAPRWPRHVLLAAGAAALLLGAAPVLEPGLLALVLLLLVLAVLLLAPVWVFAPLVVVGTVMSDVVRVVAVDAASASLLGQGRLILGIGLLLIARLVFERRRLALPRIVVPVLAVYVAGVGFSAIVGSAYGNLDFAEVQRSYSYMLAFVVGLVAFADPASRAPALRAIALLTVVGGVVALLYWGWVTGTLSAPTWLTSLFEAARRDAIVEGTDPLRARLPWADHHQNRTAVLFVLLMAATVPPLLATGRGGDALLALLASVAATGGVLATQSRTGFAVLGAGALVFAAARLLKGDAGRKRVIVALALAVPVVWVSFASLPADRAFSLEAENFQSRQEIWGDAWETFAGSPFLGHGLNYAGQSRFGSADLSAHNEYLAQLVDGGVLGGLVFVVLIATFAGMASSVARRPGVDGAVGVGVVAYIVVLAVSMSVATTWRTAAPAILSWLCFGMLAAVAERPATRRGEGAVEDGRVLEPVRDGAAHAP